MFREEDHGAELRRDLPYEARVGGEPGDVTLVAAVDEDGAHPGGTHPVLGADEVPLAKPRQLRKAEVVESLLEVSGLVSDLRWWLLLLLLEFVELAHEARRGPPG